MYYSTILFFFNTIIIVYLGFYYLKKKVKPLPDIIITNIHKKYSGVTSTIINLYPEQSKKFNIGIYGNELNIGEKHVNFIDFIFNGYKLSNDINFRIIHVRRNNEIIFALFLKYILRIPLKIVFTAVKISNYSCIPKILIKYIDHVIVTDNKCIKNIPNKSNIIDIIPHGVNQKYFNTENHNFKNDYLNLKNKFVISIFGRVRKQKGTDIFVKALIKITQKYENVIGLVVGETDIRNYFFEKELDELIRKNNLSSKIKFVGFVSYIENEDYHKYIYNRTNLTICVPKREEFGLTPIESMACGIPVICSNTGAFDSMIDEGKTGHILNNNSVNDLVSKIEYYIKNKEKLSEMKIHCINKVNNNFTIQREAKSINEVYKKILRKKIVFTINGERNSGTNFLELLLKYNGYNVLSTEKKIDILKFKKIQTFWKHGIPCKKKSNKYLYVDIFIFRDLESWLISMWKNHQHLVKKLKFDDFLNKKQELKKYSFIFWKTYIKDLKYDINRDIFDIRYFKYNKIIEYKNKNNNVVFISLKFLQNKDNALSFFKELNKVYGISEKNNYILEILKHTKSIKNEKNRTYNYNFSEKNLIDIEKKKKNNIEMFINNLQY